MSAAFVSPTAYILDEQDSNWPQEMGNYPFNLEPCGPDDYVARTYLQFLWMPNSIMPLTHLVPSLRRVGTSSADAPHPIHALIEPLLLTPRSVARKYHSELVQILTNGGGAGEMEEAMMWYAVEHEKPVNLDGFPSGSNAQKHGEDGEEGHWTDENWRKEYLERMERREVEIQILLYMFKLCFPGCHPPQSTIDQVSSKKRKRGRRPEMVESASTVEDDLEAFMDRLVMWQLVEVIGERSNHPITKNNVDSEERDWTQIFVQDIVEPEFRAQLPELCKLLHTKVFPTSPFSDTESDTPPTREASPPHTVEARSTNNPLPPTRPNTSFSRAPSRASSVILSPTSAATPPRNLIRSRSSSLSLSLAQEQEERAVAAAEQQTRKKGRLHREVSMSRVFKNKGKGIGKSDVRGGATVKVEPFKAEKADKDAGITTLVEETPVKSRVMPPMFSNKLVKPFNLEEAAAVKRDARFAEGEGQGQDEEWTIGSPSFVVF